MFNLFKRESITLVKHRYKNLFIDLPANWEYEFEQGDEEACFDPKYQSTLRLNIIKVIPAEGMAAEKNIEGMTGGQQFVITLNGYLLTNPIYSDFIDGGEDITLISWRLVNNAGHEKIIAIVSYTALTKDKDSKREKITIDLIENSLKNSELS